jgi:hypothetical protein
MTEVLTRNVVNGIDLDALTAVVGEIQEDASKALVRFSVATRWTGQTGSRTTVNGYEIAGLAMAVETARECHENPPARVAADTTPRRSGTQPSDKKPRAVCGASRFSSGGFIRSRGLRGSTTANARRTTHPTAGTASPAPEAGRTRTCR